MWLSEKTVVESELTIENLKAKLDYFERKNRELESYYENTKLTIEALRENELRYRELYENSPIVVWEEDCSQVKLYVDALSYLDDDDFINYINNSPEFVLECIKKIRVINVNQAALKLYKVQNKQILLEHLEDIFNEQALLEFKECILSIRRRVTCFEFSTETRDYENNILVVSVRWLVPPGYEHDYSKVFVSTFDLTPLNQVVNALRDSESRYRQLSAISPVGVFHCNVSGMCSFFNQSAYNITGINSSTNDTVCWFQTVHTEDKEFVTSLWYMACAKNIPFKNEMRFLHKDGAVYWGIVQITAMDNEQDEPVFIGTITDITKRRMAEDKLQEHQRELQHAVCATSLDEMVTTISHELNQPLTSIVHYAGGCLNRLRGEINGEEIKPALTKIVTQAEHAGAIIHHLKNFLHRGQLQRNIVALNQVTEEALQLLAVQLDRAQVTVKKSLSNSLPRVKIDSVQIEQVIVNIMQNAIEAMHGHTETKPCLKVETVNFASKEVAVIITDNGPGITRENIDRIFQPFFTTQPKGMGIGLAISRSIVDAHGGRLMVETPAECGAKFSVILPIDED